MWNQGPGRSSPGIPSPLNIASRPQDVPDKSAAPSQRAPSDAGDYYEDVDPRFAEPAPAALQTMQPGLDVPVAFDDDYAGPGSRSPAISERSGFTSISQRGVNPRWNPPPPGPLGPSGPSGPAFPQQMPPRRPVGRNEVNVLNSNPDFQLPTTRGGNPSPSRGPGGGMIPGSAYPGI